MRHVLVGLALAIGPMAAGAVAAQTVAPPPPATATAGTPMPDRPPLERGAMGGRGAGGLMAADANGDGIVTRDEVIAAADARFAAADSNRDGQLSPDEMAAMPGRGFRGGGPGAPAPAPTALTQQQFRDRALRPFDRVDTNHDGRIDAAEMANWRERMRERREAREGGGGQ